MDGKTTLADFIDCAIQAESKARDFYRGLAEKFPEPVEVRDFWLSMMRDEEEHLREVKAIRDALTSERLEAQKDSERLNKIREFLRFDVPEKLDSIATLDDAYRMAVNLEYSEINKLMMVLLEERVPPEGHKGMMTDIMSEHINKIEGFPKKFGDSSWRASIKTGIS